MLNKQRTIKVASFIALTAIVSSVSGCASFNDDSGKNFLVQESDTLGEASLKTVTSAALTTVAIPATVVITGTAILIPCDISYQLVGTSLVATGMGLCVTAINTGKTAVKAIDATVDVSKASWEWLTTIQAQ